MCNSCDLSCWPEKHIPKNASAESGATPGWRRVKARYNVQSSNVVLTAEYIEIHLGTLIMLPVNDAANVVVCDRII